MYELKKYLNEIFANNKNITITARKANNALDGLVEATDDELKEIYDEYITYIETHSPNDKDNALGGSNFNLVVVFLRYQMAFIEIEIKTPTKTFIVTSWGEIVDLDNQNPDEMTYKDAMRSFKFKEDDDNYTILKYKGTEKTLKFPKTIAGETVTTLGSGNEDESIIGTGCAYVPLNELAYDEENDKDIEFKKENFEAIKNALISEGITAASSCNSFEELTEILCAYEVNGQWYSIYRETEEGIEFVNKDANLGVTKVIIPENITTIKYHALDYDPWLTSVYISANTISKGTAQRSIKSSAFEGASPELKIYVETPEGWGEEQKLEALDKCFSDSNNGELLYNVIWSDEPNYVAP